MVLTFKELISPFVSTTKSEELKHGKLSTSGCLSQSNNCCITSSCETLGSVSGTAESSLIGHGSSPRFSRGVVGVFIGFLGGPREPGRDVDNVNSGVGLSQASGLKFIHPSNRPFRSSTMQALASCQIPIIRCTSSPWNRSKTTPAGWSSQSRKLLFFPT